MEIIMMLSKALLLKETSKVSSNVPPKFNLSLILVFETMVNPLDLRDGTSRDVVSQNMEVVLNVRHAYDIDVEDIEELLRFRIFMVPKTWKDDYGDWISKTAKEVSECLDAMLDEKAKVDSSLRMSQG